MNRSKTVIMLALGILLLGTAAGSGSAAKPTLKVVGPPLTPEALAGKPLDAMASTIAHGRPGTPMPPWRPMLSDTDVRWIVEQLAHGFPDEARAAR